MDDIKTTRSAGRAIVERQHGVTPAQLSVHNNFRMSIRTLKTSLLRSIYYLRLIKEGRIHRRLGYSSIYDYAEDAAGVTPRQCRAFLALGRKLDELPRIRSNLDNGRLSWRQAEEISRVATPETEQVWIESARSLTSRDLEAQVKTEKRRQRGGPQPMDSDSPSLRPPADARRPDPKAVQPPRPGGPSPNPPGRMPVLGRVPRSRSTLPTDMLHYMTFKFTTEQYVRWEAWLAEARSDDASATKEALLCRHLGNAGDRHEWRMRIVIQTCPECGSTHLPTSRGDVIAPGSLLERARCMGDVQSPDGSVKRAVPPRLMRKALARDGHRCRADGCAHTRHLEMHHVVPVARGGATALDNLVTLCAGCHRDLHEGERTLERLLAEAP